MQKESGRNLILPARFSPQSLADSRTGIPPNRILKELLSKHSSARYITDSVLPLFETFLDLAECAYQCRNRPALGEAVGVLISLPLPERLRLAAQYYQGLYVQAFGRGNLAKAAQIFLPVAERAPERYRARALISLGANLVRRGDNKSARYMYAEAARMHVVSGFFDPYLGVANQKIVAVFTSQDGDHKRALAMLETLYQQAHAFRGLHPQMYYDYLNSLAVELSEVGRIEEARNISEMVNASPLAGSYIEWRETREEIELRARRTRRTTLKINRATNDAAKPLPAAPRLDREEPRSTKSAVPATLVFHTSSLSYGRNAVTPTQAIGTSGLVEPRQARVLDLLEWKKKTGKHPYAASKRQSGKMDGRDMLLRIMELAGSRERTDEELLRILKAIEEILPNVKDPNKH